MALPILPSHRPVRRRPRPVRPGTVLLLQLNEAAHDNWLSIVAVTVVIGYAATLATLMPRVTYDVWGGLVVLPILVAVVLPLVRRLARADGDPRIARLLPWAYGIKLAASLPRYGMDFLLYHGTGDSIAYGQAGSGLADQWRTLSPAWTTKVPGTGWINVVTGVFYTITGPTLLGGFFLFGTLAFFGTYWVYRAVRIALPEADHYRFAKLVMFVPSILFWPSSIGKDSWMLFGIGLATYGAARIFKRMRGGWAVLALGLAATALVRAHITAMQLAPIAVAFMFRPSGGSRRGLNVVGKVAGVAILLAGGIYLAPSIAGQLHTDSLSVSGLQHAADFTSGHTAQGGSAFTITPLSSPIGLPMAFVTVLFRPFLFEAHNLQTLVSALEASAILVITLLSARRLRNLRRFWRRPLVLMALLYTVIFCVAFSIIGNFGILARERVQMLPIFFILLSLPKKEPARPRPIAPLQFPARVPREAHR